MADIKRGANGARAPITIAILPTQLAHLIWLSASSQPLCSRRCRRRGRQRRLMFSTSLTIAINELDRAWARVHFNGSKAAGARYRKSELLGVLAFFYPRFRPRRFDPSQRQGRSSRSFLTSPRLSTSAIALRTPSDRLTVRHIADPRAISKDFSVHLSATLYTILYSESSRSPAGHPSCISAQELGFDLFHAHKCPWRKL